MKNSLWVCSKTSKSFKTIRSNDGDKVVEKIAKLKKCKVPLNSLKATQP
jgi:hypothetical protein